MLNIRLSTAPSVTLQNSTELPRHAPLSARTLGTGAVLQINDFEREAPAALQSSNAVVNRATCPQAAQSTVTKSPSRRLKLGWATVACGGSKNKRRGTARIDLGHRVLILPT